jgi:PAS domain S-box-containing protein
VKGSLLKSYEGQVRIFLVLLVLFLAVAIYFNVHLLVVARDAIQEEVGRRVVLQADLVRAELERDQMLRGLRPEPGKAPYIPPTLLNRMARLKGMVAIEILSLDGTIISSSDTARVGRQDPLLEAAAGAARRRLTAGGSYVTPLDRPSRSRYATLAAYRPIQDRNRATLAAIRVSMEVPALGAVDFNLKLIAAFQAAGLAFVLVLVILFARWLLQPYRRLLRAAVEAPGAVPGISGAAGQDEPDYLVQAFQGVLDKLRAQEHELSRLKGGTGGEDGAALPGDHLVEGMASAVLVFDRSGRLTVLNAAAERLLGLRRGAAVGRKFGDLLGGADRLVDLIASGLRTGETISREVIPLSGPAGKVAHLGAMISPIRPSAEGSRDGQAAVEGVLCLLADLTEIKSLREKVGLKENLAALGEMSAGIAHEFRNSLATIQGLARLIVRNHGNGGEGGTGASIENAETILREVEGIEKVVDDFLRYARPKALDLVEINLQELVEDLASDLREEAGRAGVEVEVQGTFPRIVADEALLRQALRNLLVNALEAFPEPDDRREPGAMHRVPRRIALRGVPEEGSDGGVRLVVEDNGPGIPAENLPRVFKPFFTTKERGTGLGLALVQKTAVVHDGHVEVQSVAGRGATFSLVLPARPGVATPMAAL